MLDNSLVDSDWDVQDNSLVVIGKGEEQDNSLVDSEVEVGDVKIEVVGGGDHRKKGGIDVNISTGPPEKFFPAGPSDDEILEKLWRYWKGTEGKEFHNMKLEEVWPWGEISKIGISIKEFNEVKRRSWKVLKLWVLMEERTRCWLTMGSMMGWINSKVGLRLLEALYSLPISGSQEDEGGRNVIHVHGVRSLRVGNGRESR